MWVVLVRDPIHAGPHRTIEATGGRARAARAALRDPRQFARLLLTRRVDAFGFGLALNDFLSRRYVIHGHAPDPHHCRKTKQTKSTTWTALLATARTSSAR